MTYKEAAQETIKAQFADNIFNPAFAGGACGCPYHYFALNRFAFCASHCQKCWSTKYKGEAVRDFARYDGAYSFTKPQFIGRVIGECTDAQDATEL